MKRIIFTLMIMVLTATTGLPVGEGYISYQLPPKPDPNAVIPAADGAPWKWAQAPSIGGGGDSGAIVIYDHGKAVVSVKMDGSVVFGDGINPDEAARKFWEILGATIPICRPK